MIPSPAPDARQGEFGVCPSGFWLAYVWSFLLLFAMCYHMLGGWNLIFDAMLENSLEVALSLRRDVALQLHDGEC